MQEAKRHVQATVGETTFLCLTWLRMLLGCETQRFEPNVKIPDLIAMEINRICVPVVKLGFICQFQQIR